MYTKKTPIHCMKGPCVNIKYSMNYIEEEIKQTELFNSDRRESDFNVVLELNYAYTK